MTKILIIGREGQLGSAFHVQTSRIDWADFTYTTVKTLDLMNPAAIKTFFQGKKYDYIINCAAYTAVDNAETDSDAAYRLNAEAPRLLAHEAKKINACFIHISTDYVFGGHHTSPLKPDNPKTPDSVYGKSKLQGETDVMTQQPKSMIIRTSWLYSQYGKNFLKTMLQLGKEKDFLKVVFDQAGTPTLADDLAETILSIIWKVTNGQSIFVPGEYHYSNEGVCSWYDFATSIFYETNTSCKVFPVESDQFPTPARRPAYSVMDKSKIKDTYKLEISHWQESLRKCLKNMGL